MTAIDGQGNIPDPDPTDISVNLRRTPDGWRASEGNLIAYGETSWDSLRGLARLMQLRDTEQDVFSVLQMRVRDNGHDACLCTIEVKHGVVVSQRWEQEDGSPHLGFDLVGTTIERFVVDWVQRLPAIQIYDRRGPTEDARWRGKWTEAELLGMIAVLEG